MSKVYREFGAKIMVIKVAEINAPFNKIYSGEINIYRN